MLSLLVKEIKEEAKQEGREEGREESMVEYARRMKQRKYPIKEISGITGLSIEKIEKL